MTRLLVLDRNNNGSTAFKAGDVIAVVEDSHVFGAAEMKPPFRVIERPGESRESLLHLLQHDDTTLRDQYPAALLAIRRLRPALARRYEPSIKRARRYTVDTAGTATRKPLER